MRLGVISDIHGVASALGGVLDDGARLGVERWWALGDLVLFGPHPVEVLDLLDGLPDRQRTQLDDGTRLLGVHASPSSDDGPGFDMTSADEEIARLLAGVDTDWVVGGHTHDPTDREVVGIRVLNPGSVGLPRKVGSASWMVVDSTAEGAEVEHRSVEFDVGAVVDALHRRRHPNRDFVASVLSGGTFIETGAE